MNDRDQGLSAARPAEAGAVEPTTDATHPETRPASLPTDDPRTEAPASYRCLPIRAVRAALSSRSDQEVAEEWAIPVELVERLRREYRTTVRGNGA